MAARKSPGIRPTTFDEYLASVRPDQRAALEKLRKTIRAAVPEAEEGISYGLAAFRVNGRPLVAMGAASGHCALFPMDSTTVSAFSAELKDYDTSKGTIRFEVTNPPPATLVRRIVKARVAALTNATTKKSTTPRATTTESGKPRASKKNPPKPPATAKHPSKSRSTTKPKLPKRQPKRK